ncbi:MAG: hypothetical protein IK015_12310 [Treponema sp.]|nr:hypothetical protein [Treponema sp.]
MKKKATFFALLTLLLLNGICAQEFVKVTVDQKTRQAQIIDKEIDGKKMRGILVYAHNAWRNIFFDQNELPQIKQAAEKYFLDFDALKLKKGKKDTIKKYGSTPLFIEWGSDKNSIDRFSDTRADLGYVFVKQAPYFAITIHSAQNKNPDCAQLAYKDSPKLFLLFTRSQLNDLLAKIF